MIRCHNLGFDSISLRFAAATLFMVGCSATAEDPNAPGAGSPSLPTAGTSGAATFGGSGGTGGFVPPGGTGTSAGRPGTNGGSGGSSTGTGGGMAGSGSPSGGTGTAQGGTGNPGTSGGSAPVAGTTAAAGAPGGAGASGCDNYSGTLKLPSVIFTSGYGKSKSGSWQGYAYTYKFGTATITPGASTVMSCFPMMQMCAAGSIPADDGSGAGIGWSINQVMGMTTVGAVAITTPVNIQFKGGDVGMRVGLVPAVGMDEFCYTLTAADVTAASGTGGLTISLADFKSLCYDTAKATAYAGEMIKAIQVSVPGSKAGAKPFDFCLIDIEPGGAAAAP